MRCVTAGIHFIPIQSENKFAAQNVGGSMKSCVKNVDLRGEGEPLRYLQSALPSALRSFSGDAGVSAFRRTLPSRDRAQLSERSLLAPPQRDHCVVARRYECFRWYKGFSQRPETRSW